MRRTMDDSAIGARDMNPTQVAGSTPVVWTGRDVRALRQARRMSVREFAAHLGVSDRMVSKWEAAGTGIRPRPVNQAALDTSLLRADPYTRARFQQFRAVIGGNSSV